MMTWGTESANSVRRLLKSSGSIRGVSWALQQRRCYSYRLPPVFLRESELEAKSNSGGKQPHGMGLHELPPAENRERGSKGDAGGSSNAKDDKTKSTSNSGGRHSGRCTHVDGGLSSTGVPIFPSRTRLPISPLVALPKRLILIRHGESEANVDRSKYATTPDWQIALTEKGKAQAMDCGRRLQRLVKDDDLFIYYSPYKRTRQTLEGIRSFLNPEQILGEREDERLREQEMGNYQPLPDTGGMDQQWAERNRYGRSYYRFPSGESGLDVFDRVGSFFDALLKEGMNHRTLRRADPTAAALLLAQQYHHHHHPVGTAVALSSAFSPSMAHHHPHLHQYQYHHHHHHLYRHGQQQTGGGDFFTSPDPGGDSSGVPRHAYHHQHPPQSPLLPIPTNACGEAPASSVPTTVTHVGHEPSLTSSSASASTPTGSSPIAVQSRSSSSNTSSGSSCLPPSPSSALFSPIAHSHLQQVVHSVRQPPGIASAAVTAAITRPRDPTVTTTTTTRTTIPVTKTTESTSCATFSDVVRDEEDLGLKDREMVDNMDPSGSHALRRTLIDENKDSMKTITTVTTFTVMATSPVAPAAPWAASPSPSAITSKPTLSPTVVATASPTLRASSHAEPFSVPPHGQVAATATIHPNAYLSEDEDYTVVIVAHGLLIRLFIGRWFNIPTEKLELLSNPPNCSMTVLQLDPSTRNFHLTPMSKKLFGPRFETGL